MSQPKSDHSKTWFRPDIEGLRGIAILMVVLGHAGVPGFSGGFVGVDIFFVISGFVITGLLLRELRQTSEVNFLAFYARRARRLLPAFATMLIIATAVLPILPDVDQRLQIRSAFWAALWSSNIYFTLADFGYFDLSARDSMFLHTWSLGVEEQFYLIWPIFLVISWKLAHASGARVFVKMILVVVVVGFIGALLATSLWPVRAYYLMPFRLWELAAGGVCSIYTAYWHKCGNAKKIFAGGAALLIIACATISETSPYPGWLALLPVVGTICLILAGSDAEAAFTRPLASPMFMSLGRVSYGWYLWHWPVLVLARRLGHTSAVATLVAISTSLIVAIVSYLLIERFSRHARITNFKHAVLIGVFTSLLLALLPSCVRAVRHVAGDEGVSAVERRIASTIAKPQIYSIPGCDEWYMSDRLVPCAFSAGVDARNTAVILGDSAGLQWFPALANVFGNAGWNIVVLTKSACPIVDAPYFYPRIHRWYLECEIWRGAAISYVQKIRPGLVVVGSAGYAFTPQQWTWGSRRVMQQLLRGAGRVLVMMPSPRLPFDGPTCVIANAAIRMGRETPDACSVKLTDAEDRVVIDALTHAVAGVEGASILNMNDVVCPQGRCAAWANGGLVYRDSQHLNAPFVESLTPILAKRMASYIGDPISSAAQ